jgi:hypothetical protein
MIHLLCTCFSCHLHLENMGSLISEAVHRRLADASKQESLMSATAKWNFAWWSSLSMIKSSLQRIECDNKNHHPINYPLILGLYLRCNLRFCFSQAKWDIFSILCSIVPAYMIWFPILWKYKPSLGLVAAAGSQTHSDAAMLCPVYRIPRTQMTRISRTGSWFTVTIHIMELKKLTGQLIVQVYVHIVVVRIL